MQGLFMTLFWIGLLGFVVSLVMVGVSLFKKTRKAKKWSLFLAGSVVVFFVSVAGIEPAKTESMAVESETETEEPISAASEAEQSLTEGQLTVINNFQSQDFEEFTKAYYSLTLDEQSGYGTGIYLDYLHEKEVTWSGTVINDGIRGSQVLVYGYSEVYNGETWEEIENTRKASLMFFAKLQDKQEIDLIKSGDKVTFKGIIGINGEQKKENGDGINKRWKLYDAKIVSINGRLIE